MSDKNSSKKVRKLDHDEARTKAMGGWVDGGVVDASFPVDKVHQALEDAGADIDMDEFNEFFGPRLRWYRYCLMDKESRPEVQAELTLIAELKGAIELVRTRMGNLSPRADAYVNHICWNRKGELFHDFASGIDAQLEEAGIMLGMTAHEIEPYGGKRGRNHSGDRDSLLYDVATTLRGVGLRANAAAQCAGDILRACKIPAPADTREVSKIIRRWGESLLRE